MRAEWTALEENLRIGAEWVQSGVQPDGAMITHHGLGTHCGGGLRLSITGAGWHQHMVKGSGVVLFELKRSDDQYLAGVPEPDPFTEDECNELVDLVRATGLEVIETWNGAPWRTFSIGYHGAGEGLVRATQRYRDHCPRHGSVFCGHSLAFAGKDPDELNERQRDEYDCTWASDGYRTLVPPQWIAVPYPVPVAGGGPAGSTDNLEAVKRALEEIAPLLDALDIPLQTMCAGARGSIEGPDDDLAFEIARGHGVQFPAETAVRLVRLASLAAELELDTTHSTV